MSARRTSSISRQPTAIDENAPPASSDNTAAAGSRKPSALRQATALGNNSASNSRSSPRLRDKNVKAAAKARAVAIQVQLPTSDGAIEAGMPPTPPCSQSPPAGQQGAASSQTISRPGSLQSLLPPAPIRAGSLRKSRSPSAIPISISSAPLHAPQVIAARRRSSASPAVVPPSPIVPSARRKTLTSIPAPVKTKARKAPAASTSTATDKPKPRASTSTAKGRRSSIKRLPTPTETLEAPLSPSAGDSDGEDPLLLKSAAEMRGWGEGRPSLGGKSRRKSRGRSESTAREMSFALEQDEDEPSMLLQQREPEPVQLDSDFQWRDEDLLPLGSGTIEEDLPSDYEARLPATQEEEEEEEQDFGGYDGPFAGDNDYGDAETFDFAPLQEQDSDVESVADEPTLVEEAVLDEPTLVEMAVKEPATEVQEGEQEEEQEEEEEAEEPIAQEDTTRRQSQLQRPHLDYALPTDLDTSYELEYEVPIQPESSSPVRDPHSSPRSHAYTRPSPFLSSVGRPSPSVGRPSPFLSDQEHPAETSPSNNLVPLPAETEKKPFVERDDVDEEEQEYQEEERALVDGSFESQGELELKVEDEEHSASLSRSPSPAMVPTPAPVEAAEERPLPPVPRESWSRGPAFFRSSPSVSMSPVLSYPALSATSPDMSSRRGGSQEHDAEEDEDEEDEIVLAGGESRARSSSAAVEDSLFLHRSVSGTAPRSRAGSYASSIGRQSAQGDESDASLSSPHRPLSIAEVSMASPRRPLSLAGDVQMSSPSPQRRSPASQHSPQLPQHSPSLHRKLPAAPPVEALAEEELDAQMASPSPVRRTAPASAERLMAGGIVQMGRQTLQGLFGASPVSKEAKGKGREENVDGEQDGAKALRSSTAFVVETVPAAITTTGSVPTPRPTVTAAAPREPATIAPLARDLNAQSTNFTPIPRPLSLPSTTHGKPSQSIISRSALRRRPSHPTLPVVEISSTDPKAAARAAAILKVYHDYVEQGLEAPGSLLEEAGIRRSAIKGGKKAVVASARKGQQVEEGVSIAESELRELLDEAEEEVREAVERRSVSVSAEPSTASHSSRSRKQGRRTDTPTSSRLAMDGSSSRLASPLRASAAIVEDREWSSAEWRRLELALVEEGRVTRKKDTELVVEKVLRRFLNGEGLNREQCVGQWAWDKLVIRVTALQKRRYQDSLRRSSSRASSRAPSLSSSVAPIPGALPRRRRRSLHEELREAEGSLNADASSNADTERAPSPIVKVEQFSDDEAELSGSLAATASLQGSEEDEDSDSEPDRNVEDDTFFERPRPTALAPPSAGDIRRSPSVDPITGAIRPPPALAGSRFAHLYDEPVEKPRLPSQSWVPPASEELEEGDTTAELEEGSSYERSEGTPEAGRQPSEAPSSARKLFSYIGNLVRRPSATPEPEMREITFARTQQPFPSTSQRKISPLPPSRSAPSTSTSTPTVAITPAPLRLSTTSYPATAPAVERRRRSSGEGKVWSQIAALEDAESSREEDARVIELLQSGGAAKRRASGGDLRGASTKAAPVYGSPAVFVPAGTRALDRPIGEKKAGRGW